MSDVKIYVLRRTENSVDELPTGASAATVAADRYGNVIFREEVELSVFERGLENCVSVALSALKISRKLTQECRVEKITLKLGIDASVGCAFVGDASVKAGIEIEIKVV